MTKAERDILMAKLAVAETFYFGQFNARESMLKCHALAVEVADRHCVEARTVVEALTAQLA